MKREVDFYVFGLLKQQLGIERTVVTLNTWHTDVGIDYLSIFEIILVNDTQIIALLLYPYYLRK